MEQFVITFDEIRALLVEQQYAEKDIEEAKNKIKESVNPAKWICTEAEKVYVESNNNKNK